MKIVTKSNFLLCGYFWSFVQLDHIIIKALQQLNICKGLFPIYDWQRVGNVEKKIQKYECFHYKLYYEKLICFTSPLTHAVKISQSDAFEYQYVPRLDFYWKGRHTLQILPLSVIYNGWFPRSGYRTYIIRRHNYAGHVKPYLLFTFNKLVFMSNSITGNKLIICMLVFSVHAMYHRPMCRWGVAGQTWDGNKKIGFLHDQSNNVSLDAFEWHHK